MFDMKQQMVMSIPNPGDWMTRGAAAEILSVSVRTIERYVTDGTLRGFKPLSAEGEKGPVLLWRGDVLELEAAMKRVKRGKLVNA